MVVVALLSVDLVESVDLVSVNLVVNCIAKIEPVGFYDGKGKIYEIALWSYFNSHKKCSNLDIAFQSVHGLVEI